MDAGNATTRVSGSTMDGTTTLGPTTGPAPGPGSLETPPTSDGLQFLDVIGRGGFGAVYRAADDRLGRVVAAKVLLDDRSGRERFLAEAMITGNLQHPHIIPVHSLAVDPGGRDYFTMPVVQGQSLFEIIRKLAERDPATTAAYTLPRLIAILVAVADAVTYAHARGVVHRDLKPQNIMLGHFGEVFVLDWGLAKLMHRPATEAVMAGATTSRRIEPLDADTVPTLSGSVSGTPGYMAPEQARGDNDEVGFPADIYALGVILFQLLTLDMPVDISRADTALLATVEGRLRDPDATAAGRHVPRPLAMIAGKAMALERTDRYPSASALVADLRAWLEDREVSACPDGPLRRAGRWLRRHRTATALIGGTLGSAVVAAIVILALNSSHNAESARLADDRARYAKEALAQSERANAAELARSKALERRANAFREYLPGLDQLARAEKNSVWAKRAIATFDRALAIDPEFAEAHRARARALDLGDRSSESIAAYQRALELSHAVLGHEDPELIRAIGDVFWTKLRDFAAVAEWYRRAAAADPANPHALMAKGVLRSLEGDNPGAITDLRALATKEPDWWEVHEALAMLLMGRSPRVGADLRGGPNGITDIKGAVAALSEAIRLNPVHATLYLERGQARTIQYFSGDTQESLLTGCLSDYDTAVSLRPDSLSGHCARMSAYYWMKKMALDMKSAEGKTMANLYQKTLQQEIEVLRQRWPTHPSALATRATAEVPAGQGKALLAEVEAALAAEPQSEALLRLRDSLRGQLDPKAKVPEKAPEKAPPPAGF